MKNKYLIIGLGILLGGAAGFLYWNYIGCENGCTIQSVWWRMTIWGAAMGGLIANIFTDIFNRKKEAQ